MGHDIRNLKFLFVKRHRAAVEVLEHLVFEFRISGSIDHDASDWAIENLFLMLFCEIPRKLVIQTSHPVEFSQRELVGNEIDQCREALLPVDDFEPAVRYFPEVDRRNRYLQK